VVRAPYRIVYRRLADVVEILTVHHSSRPIPPDVGTGGGTA
jgi:hypothetical protein